MLIFDTPVRFLGRNLVTGFMLCLALSLSACKTDLYSQLTEPDANEMLATLRGAGLEASKQPTDGGKGWRVTVADEQVVQAMNLLRESGLPRKAHANLGELFKKDGMVSSPAEDKVRFLHGVSQELSETLTRIDGVVTARVHIVLPDNDPRNRQQTPSSASVFVKHHPAVSMASYIPSVRQLVARSIEGLDAERVSVTLVPAQVAFEPPTQKAESHSWLWLMLAGSLILALGSFTAWHLHRRQGVDAADALKWPKLSPAQA